MLILVRKARTVKGVVRVLRTIKDGLAGEVIRRVLPGVGGKGTEYAQEQAGAAAKDLPNAQTVLDVLNAYCDDHAPATHAGEVEGIDRIEPGKLWLNPLTAGN